MMIPNMGNKIPKLTNDDYRLLISGALHDELGGSGRAIKTVQVWTNANERTVKNWFAGHAGPQGEHLLMLMRHSEVMLQAVLETAGWKKVATAVKLLEAVENIDRLMVELRQLRSAMQHSLSEDWAD